MDNADIKAGMQAVFSRSADRFTADVRRGRYQFPDPGPRGPGKIFDVGNRVRLMPSNPICRFPLEGTVIEEHVGDYGYQWCTVRLEGYAGNPCQTFRASDLGRVA